MFYYIISDNEYDDYYYTMLVHENEFNKKEFCTIYNDIVERLGKNSGHRSVVWELCNNYGFKEVEVKYEINSCYDNHRKLISFDEMENEEDAFISKD
ncbi:hypothetical protein [Paenibacillus silvae]|uniref:Uncharacterized protein n=1 Tax=Paenibacillus silvae TaxID=1325358 RepID=A0A2W6PCJ9_9BACL|nr:hypothetical protein [Paenibacillus silvae]PZT57390.1 hypothetical protein DN757_01665 [Paenibacillus silvae]